MVENLQMLHPPPMIKFLELCVWISKRRPGQAKLVQAQPCHMPSQLAITTRVLQKLEYDNSQAWSLSFWAYYTAYDSWKAAGSQGSFLQVGDSRRAIIMRSYFSLLITTIASPLSARRMTISIALGSSRALVTLYLEIWLSQRYY